MPTTTRITTKTINVGPTTDGSSGDFINDGLAKYDGSTGILDIGAQFGVVSYKAAPPDVKSGTWIRYKISGIPKGATINDATLKIYGCRTNGSTFGMTIKGADLSDAGNPTGTGSVLFPSPVIGNTVTTSWTQSGFYFSLQSYVLQEIDVKNMVQALVNKYDYFTPKHMLFLFNNPNSSSTGVNAIMCRDFVSITENRIPALEIKYTQSLFDKTHYVYK